jgi:hypothetical protein
MQLMGDYNNQMQNPYGMAMNGQQIMAGQGMQRRFSWYDANEAGLDHLVKRHVLWNGYKHGRNRQGGVRKKSLLAVQHI